MKLDSLMIIIQKIEALYDQRGDIRKEYRESRISEEAFEKKDWENYIAMVAYENLLRKEVGELPLKYIIEYVKSRGNIVNLDLGVTL